MKMLKFTLTLFTLISKLSTIFGSLLPASVFQYTASDAMLPKQWTSIRDCPVRYYEFGRSELVAPVGGERAKKGEFAHMAAIGWTQSNGEILWNCGGSLISPSFVLTAAHCGSFEGLAPDVVRLGDIDLSSADDDENVQEFKVAEFISHPQYIGSVRYYDIALIRLEGEARINHSSVVPACLWRDNNIHYSYKRFEACGWGQTSFGGQTTSTLLKVSLTLYSNDECDSLYERNRRLKDGITDQHVCAGDRGLKMDTCPGDSGGPLQIKLFANNRVIPFVVGATSFGKACATVVPGVYTRVSHFIDWIETITGIDFEPKKCAIRYSYLRELDPDIVVFRSEELTQFNTEKSRFELGKYFAHRAEVGWRNGNNIEWNCGGTIIDERFVLTTATCVLYRLVQNPNVVRVGLTPPKDIFTLKFSYTENSTILEIEKIYIHPLHNLNNPHIHDIALIQLKDEIQFGGEYNPACLADESANPPEQVEITGFGPHNNFLFYTSENNQEANEDFRRFVIVQENYYDFKNCTVTYANDTNLYNKITRNHVCYGFEKNIVPGICEIEVGEPSERWLVPFRTNRWLRYVLGLTSYSRECGSGTPVVQIKPGPYIDWIDSIIFGTNTGNFVPTTEDFYHTDIIKYEGDKCELPSGEKGVCQVDTKCPEITKKFKASDVICSFKGNQPMICCPKSQSVKLEAFNFFNDCPKKYEKFRRAKSSGYFYENYDHIGILGRTQTDNQVDWNCYATLISENYLLTSTSCLPPYQSEQPDVVLLGDFNRTSASQAQIIKIAEITRNNPTENTFYNDLVLIKLEKSAQLSQEVVPACLWIDEERTPFLPHAIGWYQIGTFEKRCNQVAKFCSYVRSPFTLLQVVRNEECSKSYASNEILNEGVKASQLCAVNENRNDNTCFEIQGSPLQIVSIVNGREVPFLVGVTSYVSDCEENKPAVFTRVLELANWIFDIVNRKN